MYCWGISVKIMQFSKNVFDFMTVYGSILVENNVDEGSRLPLQLLFSLGLKTKCWEKRG